MQEISSSVALSSACFSLSDEHLCNCGNWWSQETATQAAEAQTLAAASVAKEAARAAAAEASTAQAEADLFAASGFVETLQTQILDMRAAMAAAAAETSEQLAAEKGRAAAAEQKLEAAQAAAQEALAGQRAAEAAQQEAQQKQKRAEQEAVRLQVPFWFSCSGFSSCACPCSVHAAMTPLMAVDRPLHVARVSIRLTCSSVPLCLQRGLNAELAAAAAAATKAARDAEAAEAAHSVALAESAKAAAAAQTRASAAEVEVAQLHQQSTVAGVARDEALRRAAALDQVHSSLSCMWSCSTTCTRKEKELRQIQ